MGIESEATPAGRPHAPPHGRVATNPATVLADKISALKLREPLCVASGSGVGEVIATVQRHLEGAVLICDGGKPIGIMTEQDVLMKIVARDVKHDEAVDKFMTANPFTLRSSSTIREAIALMNKESIRHVPVVDGDGKATAMLQVQDIVHHLAESFPEHVVNLPPRPHQKMETPEGA
jgi:signal-transduction protein with cAMP-binding, CBS, and nucleotidyltransferase domain